MYYFNAHSAGSNACILYIFTCLIIVLCVCVRMYVLVSCPAVWWIFRVILAATPPSVSQLKLRLHL